VYQMLQPNKGTAARMLCKQDAKLYPPDHSFRTTGLSFYRFFLNLYSAPTEMAKFTSV
jgi:hypothetical protein